ncbi:DUF4440 domain-containing protein [Comamonas sp. SY3]|uniref:nuclear transport factor 2 family protein n=1 Tax=Comamonas sp. SY3 TaxID=3243601 RepID=UPI0035931487
MDPTLTQQLSQLEAQLHLPEIRHHQPEHVSQLLHPAFEETGRSGQRYTRETVVEALRAESNAAEIVADGYAATVLAPGVALLTYRSALCDAQGTRSKHTLRSSIWLLTDGRWQLRYHQGTPALDNW